MPDVFKLDGLYKHSSENPTLNGQPRADFWRRTIDAIVKELPETQPGTQPVYVATGGGYGSNGGLINYAKMTKTIGENVVPLSGNMFRGLPEFEKEKERVREQIRAHLGKEAIEANPGAVEQTLSAFYSDEVNTKIAKEAVKAALDAKKSVLYESASIYPDTLERAQKAQANGVKTILLAGDMNLDAAIAANKNIEPSAVAASYQKFSDRFEKELVPAFDEIRLYNTTGQLPELIARKTGADQQLQIIDPEPYRAFLNKRLINPASHNSPTASGNIVAAEHRDPKRYRPGADDTAPTRGNTPNQGPSR